jgi:DNA-binding response OmpR family regulator
MKANDSSSGTGRILCVDDNENIRALMRVLIGSYGYQPVIAGSFSEALEQTALGGFALYILDNKLGSRSGIDLCERIRASDQHTPIMFYSAAGFTTDIQKGLDAGAQAYLVKPNISHLKEAIDRLVL